MIGDPLVTDSASSHDLAVRGLEVEFSRLFTQLRRLHADIARRIDERLLPGHYKALSMIAHRAPVTAGTLSECLHTDKAQTSRTVRELEDFGLVTRRPDPHDGRSSFLELSPAAEIKLAEARTPLKNPLIAPLEDWDVTDIEHLATLLRALSTAQRPDEVRESATMVPAPDVPEHEE